MIATNPSTAVNPQPKPRLLARARQLLLAAFLTFGLAVPFASANCLGKALTQPHSASRMPALSAPAEPSNPTGVEADMAATIVGLWNLNFYYQGQVVDVAFDAWHSDGTEVLNDYTDPIEGNVCLGVWERTGANTYTLKHPSWYFDGNGVLLGTVVIHEIVTISADGNKFSGRYADDIYDVTGNLLEELTGTLAATRIKVN
ncbi:MAG: hypothetical protein ABR987_10360 [Terracidiphilus sp.]|jgi:hypothetical protein